MRKRLINYLHLQTESRVLSGHVKAVFDNLLNEAMVTVTWGALPKMDGFPGKPELYMDDNWGVSP